MKKWFGDLIDRLMRRGLFITNVKQTKVCPRCSISLPIMDEKGQHNFCPTIAGGKVISVCMKCKLFETSDPGKGSKR
jgi:hypothetical protein